MWRICVTTVAVEHDNAFCVCLELHVTVNYIKIFSVAQQCLYGTFMSLATIKPVDLHVNCLVLHWGKRIFIWSWHKLVHKNFKFKAAILIQVEESEWCQMHSCDAVYIVWHILLAGHSVMSLYKFGMYFIYTISYTNG